MATRTVSYKVCDGCHRTNMIPGAAVEIVQTREVTRFCGPTNTLDACADCDEAGKFICHLCAHVHDDDNPCDAILRRIEDANPKETN